MLSALVMTLLVAGIEPADPPAGAEALAPNICLDDGTVRLTWIESADTTGARRLRHAAFTDGAWSEATTIVERDDFFANWADVPSMVRAPDGSLLVHWLQRSGDATYAYDVVLARSVDDGASWTTLGPAHDDGTETEHGFVSMVPDGEAVRVFWLDGRAMAADDHGHGTGNMVVRTTLVSGNTIATGEVLDHRVCECCPTDALVTSHGPIVVYRDRSMEEERDIFLVRKTPEGWSKPRPLARDGWEIAGCPVNGPALAGAGRDVVAAWYTGSGHRPRVSVAFSRDAGATFSSPVVIDDDDPIGRVGVASVGPNRAVVTWLATTETPGIAAVMVAEVDRAGVVQSRHVAGKTTTSRASGVPRVAVTAAGWLVIWTDGEARRLHAVVIDA